MPYNPDGQDPLAYLGLNPSKSPYTMVAKRAPVGTDKQRIGTRWIDTTAQASYECVGYTAGAAVWEPVAGASVALETLTGDSGGALSPSSGNINILGGEGMDVTGSGSTLTIAGEDATTSNKGIASFATADFGVSSGAVDLNDAVVKSVSSDSGTATPASHSFTVAGGNAVSTSGSGSTVTVAVDSDSIATDELVENTIQYATVSITAAEVKALATTPITLVAAPGAGKVIQFCEAQFKLVYGSEVFAESGDNLGIKYTDASGFQVSNTIEMTGFIDQSANTYTNAIAAADAIVAATGTENQPLVLDNLGSNITGNASNDSTLEVAVAYRVHTL